MEALLQQTDYVAPNQPQFTEETIYFQLLGSEMNGIPLSSARDAGTLRRLVEGNRPLTGELRRKISIRIQV